jgi:dienelactone hydrolase
VTGRRSIAAVALAVAMAAAACSSGAPNAAPRPSTTTAPPPRPMNPAYARPGPYPVSFHTLHDGSRAVDVFAPGEPGSTKGHPPAWYDIRAAERPPNAAPLPTPTAERVILPAFRDLPPPEGVFPVVLFSHGFGAQPLQNATLEADLAAWGFVVIAPDHTERDTYALMTNRASVNDVRDAVVLHSALIATARDPLVGPMMNLSRVAAVGHAQGGSTALAALALPDVDAGVAWASTAPKRAVAAKPALLIGAQHDLEFGTSVQQKIYARLTRRRALVLLGGGAGHATFADDCEGLRVSGQLTPGDDVRDPDNPGGLLELAQNGCFPDEVDPTVAWPVITHFTVAFLRSVFGIDSQAVGLGDGIADAFPKLPLTYEHQL